MNDSPKVAGYIGYYGLSEWWFSAFSEEERAYINHRVRTMRAGPNALIEGTPFIPKRSTHNNVSFFLINLTVWFKQSEENHIARRIAVKAYELAEDIDDINSALSLIIRLNYYVRDTVPEAYDTVIAACKHQIEIAPLVAKKHKREYPNLELSRHEGYTRYVILLEKNREYEEAIRLSKKAKKQGWQGDWDKRIERCSKRLSKIKMG